MDPREFLDTARDLVSNAARETDLRSAISRAYYCAYHVAWAAVRDGVDAGLRRRARLTKRLDHKVLFECLEGSSDPEVKEAGSELRSLHATRVRADYHYWRQISRQQVEQAIEDAEEQRVAINELTPKRIGAAATPVLKVRFP